MRTVMKLSLAASVSAFALCWGNPHGAKAADMPAPEAQFQAPPSEYYGPPPVEQGYAYPPPVVYGYPPLPPVAYYAYAAPPVVFLPGPYYGRGPYWRGYGPRYSYGYGHWGRSYRRW
jgi:hypothetical protein